jgi:gliding motility-associated lipoprotein GldB
MTITFKNALQIYSISCLTILLCSCGRTKKVDVSDIDVQVKIERFDKDFNRMSGVPMQKQASFLQKKYGAFYRDFIEQILPVGTLNDTTYFHNLRQVFKTKAYVDLKHDVDSIYLDLNKQEAELTDAFKRIKYYFPKQRLPKVYAYLSGFQAQTSIGDDYVGIGLDLFLGADSKFYPSQTEVFPRYISKRFTPENIAPRVIEAIAREDMFPEDEADKTLLSKMIYNGKIMYFMDMTLPDVADSIKIGYTTKQLDWANEFRAQTWAYFLDENLLYETDYQKIQKYITEAPFTAGLGEKNESAPKLGTWTGWQIVKQYMDKHPDVTLAQLMLLKDAQMILNEAKYRPK